MGELDGAFGVVEADGDRIALHGEGFDAEVAGAPHLVEHHLGVFAATLYSSSEEGSCCRLGYPQHLALLVVGEDAVHLLKVLHVAGPCGFPAIDPELAEVNGAAVEVRDLSHQQLALAFPVGDGHAAADDGVVAFEGQPAVLGAETERLI